MGVLKKISNIIDKIIQGIITVFLSLMTLTLFVQIVARYVFQAGTVWTDELSRFLMVWMVCLGATVLTKSGGHITVSIIEDFVPAARKWLAPIQKIFMLIYAIILVKYGIDTLQIVGPQLSPNMRISMGIIYSVLPITAILMIIHLVFQGKNSANSDERTGGL